MIIALEDNFAPDIFFIGTDSEIEEAEKESQRNKEKILYIANLVRAGAADYAYTDTEHVNSRISRLVLHRSAKYGNDLQLTCLNYQGASFLYPVYDCRIDSDEKLLQEWTGYKFIIK